MNNIGESYTVTVQVEFGKLSGVMDWCRQYCTGNWHITNYNADGFSINERTLTHFENWYSFDFDNERDYLTFNLKFK